MQRNPDSAKPITIGFIACDAYEEVSNKVWQGVSESAEKAGFNLIFFAGGPIHDPIGYRQEGNVVYDLIQPERIDGIILLASSLDFAASRQEMTQFIKKFGKIPIICLEEEFPGLACILKDEYAGMRKAANHLIVNHQRKQIVFMRGPMGFVGSQKRYQAYLDALTENNLPFDPNLVMPNPASWSYSEAVNNFQSFLEDHALRPRFDFDAVLAVNDENALAAIHVLQSLKVRIPDDVPVVGFDDLALAGSNSPALTTMRPPFLEMGRRAIATLESIFNGKLVNQLEMLPVHPVIRHSCGCLLPTITEASSELTPVQTIHPNSSSLASRTAGIRRAIIHEMADQSGGKSGSTRWAGQILNGFINEMDHNDPGSFLSALDQTMNQVIAGDGRVKEWQRAISVLRDKLFPYLQDTETIAGADNLLHQARVMIGELSWRNQSWKRLQAIELARRLRLLGNRLATCIAMDSLVDVLCQELPRLGIPSCYLVLFDDPSNLNEKVKFIMGYDRSGPITLSDEYVRYNCLEILPQQIWKGLINYNLLIEGLFLKSEFIGFIIFETDSKDWGRESGIFDALQMQISSAMKAVLLHQEAIQAKKEAEAGWRLAEERRQTAEEANQLKSRFLSMVSHELRTPLNVIAGLSENLLHDIPTDIQYKDTSIFRDVERIHSSAKHLDNLIRDVLDLAVSQVGQLKLIPERLQIDETLKPVIEIGEKLAREKGLNWQVDLPSGLPALFWDRTRLRQVVLNLLTNAIKFTDQGEVSLRVEMTDVDLVISVQDTGLGILMEDQALIFEEFHRTERATARGYGGMGLGLAICRRLVELGGGKIGVESDGQIGSGSKFFFSLPLNAVSDLQVTPSRGQTVLLLKKGNGQPSLINDRLSANGFEIEEVDYSAAENWLPSVLISPPGAIILDFHPETEDGWELIRVLKKHPQTQDIPIMFYSIAPDSGSGAILELNYLQKPLAGNLLTQTLLGHGFVGDDRQYAFLIVDDDRTNLELHSQLVKNQFPNCQVYQAAGGQAALEIMNQVKLDLVLLDLMMPDIDGFQVLARMRENETMRGIPVVILTSQTLSDGEMQRLNQGVTAVLEKGIFSKEETLIQVEAALKRNKRLGSEARRVARRAMAFIHEYYATNISRKEVAEHIGVSQEYLSTCFNRETGVTLSTYIERFRVRKAKMMLEVSDANITEIAVAVGICDSSYFGRVFRREVGVTPAAYRKGDRKS